VLGDAANDPTCVGHIPWSAATRWRNRGSSDPKMLGCRARAVGRVARRLPTSRAPRPAHALIHYKCSARELWKFCGSVGSGSESAANMLAFLTYRASGRFESAYLCARRSRRATRSYNTACVSRTAKRTVEITDGGFIRLPLRLGVLGGDIRQSRLAARHPRARAWVDVFQLGLGLPSALRSVRYPASVLTP
jgi:hypothetical protein